MLWHELTIYTTEEATEAIADWLHAQGAGGVSIEESGTLDRKRDTSLGQWYEKPLNDIPEGDAVMQAYFGEETDMEAIQAGVKELLAKLPSFGLNPGRGELSLASIQEEAWAEAWKQYFKPTHVSERLVIKPTWETYEPKPHETIIELDPGMAFGTGTHATTALCMRTLETVVKPGDHVIDVGTGSGILAVTAIRLGAEHVLALDLDPVAVSSAKENAKLNRLEERITVQLSDLLGALKTTEASPVKLPVQVVVANILAEIIATFVDDVYQALETGGAYVASGIITSKEDLVTEALTRAGFEMESRSEENGWVALVARKR
ncbi:50S ribosomal protein L11 methyltransferase [Paenibacillus antri]|uniref:Ribosomal protein L11 methyltransferase n=1 Tax=Paenibacillus antri TaxID=2582848 RepID=A0A5R9G1V2_9BACL|nr:50S ribosomal protein L11 methyltransferase [Paenibacillus antri]TLS50322.1 50S ribosomal protein L11 methyltransferase [Paenibacillus antri]